MAVRLGFFFFWKNILIYFTHGSFWQIQPQRSIVYLTLVLFLTSVLLPSIEGVLFSRNEGGHFIVDIAIGIDTFAIV